MNELKFQPCIICAPKTSKLALCPSCQHNRGIILKLTKPRRPLYRLVDYNNTKAFCPKCGSSMQKIKLFSKSIKCIHPECGFVRHD